MFDLKTSIITILVEMNVPPAIPPTLFFKHITFQEQSGNAATPYNVIDYHHLIKSLIKTSTKQQVSPC